MASSIQDIYITGLRNAHALEAQADQLLSRQVERIENYPAMRQRLQQHIEETRRQSQRLEQILQAHGTSESTLKDLATGFMGNMAALAHAPMQDEVLKNSFANYAFEHFEIASYRALIEMAQQAGDQQGIQLLQESLKEEIAMAEWAGQNLPDVVQTYIRLETQGKKSGI
ncbi:ferritin-like domain-containing protein [Paracraurococcus lichenis]|uniref:Ferritin-like domain-containing protein n=1 Tax=Paracraurococcus lichenis TaxID=3064888 RepID=A0ABT9DVR0_9PROT|nr:ferritin-like domain-containing protein [Paracraurococcus sp. LOR1-02]MDO9707990.1 ferritin-like domain-containing protein [Paracraurococcus sp. LOR1-02]